MHIRDSRLQSSYLFTSFSGHRPAQREYARTGLRSYARFHPYPIPQPVKVGHTTGVYDAYSFRIVMWGLLRPTRTNQWKCCEAGPTVFRPYPRRLESLIICRCHYKGSNFFSVIQRPWVLVRSGFEPSTSCSADRRSPNWANQAASLCTHKKTKDLGSRVGTTLRLFKKVSFRSNLQREI